MSILSNVFDSYTLISSLDRADKSMRGIPLEYNSIERGIIETMIPHPVILGSAQIQHCDDKSEKDQFEASLEDYYAHTTPVDIYKFSLVSDVYCSASQEWADKLCVYEPSNINNPKNIMKGIVYDTYKPILFYQSSRKAIKGEFIILVSDIMKSLRHPFNLYDKNFNLKEDITEAEYFHLYHFTQTFYYLYEMLYNVEYPFNIESPELPMPMIPIMEDIKYDIGFGTEYVINMRLSTLLLLMSYYDMIEELITSLAMDIVGYEDVDDLRDKLMIELTQLLHYPYNFKDHHPEKILNNIKTLFSIAKEHMENAKSSLTLPEKYLVMHNVKREYDIEKEK